MSGDTRTMQGVDVSAVVAIHINAFPGYFLTLLGPVFLRELYDAIIADPAGIACVYQNATGILGFAAGTAQPSGFFRRLLRRRWWRFGLASLSTAVRHPVIIPRLFRALEKPHYYDPHPGEGLLMSIAVRREFQGQHLGSRLLDAFLESCSQRGLAAVSLTTDSKNNDAGNLFYQRCGFALSGYFETPEGRGINEYRINLGEFSK